MNLNIIFQDNTSTIKLVENVKLSSVKSTHHVDIRQFHVTELISWKEVAIKCCLVGKILDDFFSKPLIGKLFLMMRSDIMNVASRE